MASRFRQLFEQETQDALDRVPTVPDQPSAPPVDLAKAQTLARSSNNPQAQQLGSAMLRENDRQQVQASREAERQAKVDNTSAKATERAQAKAIDDNNARNLRAAAAQGAKVETDVTTGKRTVATHPDGSPMAKVGPVGKAFVQPTYDAAASSIPGMGGFQSLLRQANQQSLDQTQEVAQKYRDDKFNTIVQPLPSDTDPKTGSITSKLKDEFGAPQTVALGTDQAVASKVAKDADFEQRRQQIALRSNAVSQERLRFDPQWEPVKKEFDAAGKDLNDYPATFRRNKFGNFDKVDPKTDSSIPYDSRELVVWQKGQQVAKERADQAKVAHDKMSSTAENLNRNETEIKDARLKLVEEKIRHDAGMPEEDGGAAAILAQASGEVDQSPEQKALQESTIPMVYSPEVLDAAAKSRQSPEPVAKAVISEDTTNPDAVLKSFSGLQHAAGLTLEQRPGSAFTPIQKDGRWIGSIEDGGNGQKVITLTDAARQDADINKTVALGVTSGAPLYLRDNGKKKDVAAEANYVASVYQAMQDPNIASQGQMNARLGLLGATQNEIKAKVDAGELSMQHGESLLKNLYGDTLKPTELDTPQAFAKWIDETSKRENDAHKATYGTPASDSVASRWGNTTNLKDKNEVRQEYLRDWYQSNRGKPGVTREKMRELYGVDVAASATTGQRVGSALKTGGRMIRDDVGGSMLGLAAKFVVGIGAAEAALFGSQDGKETLADISKMTNRDTANWTEAAKRNVKIWGTDAGQAVAMKLDQAVGDFQRAIDEENEKPVPDKERIHAANEMVSNAALALHGLSPDPSWPITADNMDPDKDPALGAALARYALTADPREMQLYKERLLMSNGRRQFSAEMEKKTAGKGALGSAVIGGMYSGWQEVASELAADAAVLATAGGSKMIQKGLKIAGAVNKAGKIERIGMKIGAALDRAEAFGVEAESLVNPLSKADKTANLGKRIAKAVVIGAGGEGGEEVLTEVGSDSPNFVQAFAAGALGGVVLGPIEFMSHPISHGINERAAAAQVETANVRWTRSYNASMADQPGFTAITPEQAMVARSFVDQQAFQAVVGTIATRQGEITKPTASVNVARYRAERDAAVRHLAIITHEAVAASQEISEIEDPAERLRYTAIAKVATGNEAALTKPERTAVQGGTTPDGAPMFAEVGDGAVIRTVLTDEARAHLRLEMPAVGALVRSTQSDAIYDQLGSQSPTTQINEPNPSVGSGGAAAAGPVQTQAQAPVVGPNLAAMDAVEYEKLRQQDTSLPEMVKVVQDAFSNNQPVSVSMVDKAGGFMADDSGILTPAGYTRRGAMMVPPAISGSGPNETKAPNALNSPARLKAEAAVERASKRFPNLKAAFVYDEAGPTGQGQDRKSAGAYAAADQVTINLADLGAELSGFDETRHDERIDAVIDEEIKHVAQFEDARRKSQTVEVYGKTLWNGFTPEQQAAAANTYQAGFEGLEDWKKGFEAVRMLIQNRADGKVTELTKAFHKKASAQMIEMLRAAVEFLKAAVTGGEISKTVQDAIEGIESILAEYAATETPSAATTPAIQSDELAGNLDLAMQGENSQSARVASPSERRGLKPEGQSADEKGQVLNQEPTGEQSPAATAAQSLAEATETIRQGVLAARKEFPQLKDTELGYDLEDIVFDMAEPLAEVPAGERKAMVDAAIAAWVESQAEILQPAKATGTTDQKAHRKAWRQAAQDKLNAAARAILNSGVHEAFSAVFHRGKITPTPNILALIRKRKADGKVLTQNEIGVWRNSSEWDGALKKSNYTGGGMNPLARAMIDLIMARQGEGQMPDTIADSLMPKVTTASEMWEQLAKELRTVTTGKNEDRAGFDPMDDPNYEPSDAEIAEWEAKQAAAAQLEDQQPHVTLADAHGFAVQAFGAESPITQKIGVVAEFADRFARADMPSVRAVVEAEFRRHAAGKSLVEADAPSLSGPAASFYKFFITNPAEALRKALASLPVVDAGSALFASPSPEFGFNQTTDTGDASQKGFNFDALPPGPDAKFVENTAKAYESARNDNARKQIAKVSAAREGITRSKVQNVPQGMMDFGMSGSFGTKDHLGLFASPSNQRSLDFGTRGSFDTKKQRGFDFGGNPTPEESSAVQDAAESQPTTAQAQSIKQNLWDWASDAAASTKLGAAQPNLFETTPKTTDTQSNDIPSSTNLESDRQQPNTGNGSRKSGVPTRRGSTGQAGRSLDEGGKISRDPGQGSTLPARVPATTGGVASDSIVPQSKSPTQGSASRDSGSSERSGRDDGGLSPERPRPSEPRTNLVVAPQSTGTLAPSRARGPQSGVSSATTGGWESPLTPEQKGDVEFIESRLNENGHPGVLLTNGTGTGKTFSGLGAIKQALDRGAKHILVMAPSDKVGGDWKATAQEFFGIHDASQLADTKDNGGSNRLVFATYANLGQNTNLVNRPWEILVADEAHYLSQNKDGKDTNALDTFRALTWHQDGIHRRAEMLEPEAAAKIAAIKKLPYHERNSPILNAQWEQAEGLLSAAREREKAKQPSEADRPKAILLSATPFAWHFSLDYAEGYLFDHGPEPTSTAYNTPSARNQFYVENFGYRMRTGKLTQPDAAAATVTGILERRFAEKLMKENAMSGRALQVEQDYSRQFILSETKLGEQLDTIIKAIRENPRFAPLSEYIGLGDYLARRYLLEGMKARESVDRIHQHLDMGRKVVVFHDYKKGGAMNPLQAVFHKGNVIEKWDNQTRRIEQINLPERLAELKREIPLFEATKQELDGLLSPIDRFTREFPEARIYNGSVPKGQRRAIIDDFNRSGGSVNMILVQRASGKEGISLHDRDGKHHRVFIDIGLANRPTDAIQGEGRIYRHGVKSNAVIEYLSTGTDFERQTFAETIAKRSSTAENLAMGERARSLLQSFATGYNEAEASDPGTHQGTGGKEMDRQIEEGSSYKSAVALFYTNQKKTSRNKSSEGQDYFATPEPLGFKMVEWADIAPGDKVLEPSAGHGAIARFFPDSTNRHGIEPSSELASRLALNATDITVHRERFEDFHIANKFNAVVMNPPFGTAGKTAMDHLVKALGHLRNGGRVVVLIPEGSSMEKRFDKWYESDEAKNYYVRAEIKMPSVTFSRAGTGVSTRVVIIDKLVSRKDDDRQNLERTRRDLTRFETLQEFIDELEFVTVPPRLEVAPTAAEEADTAEIEQEQVPSPNLVTGGRDFILPSVPKPETESTWSTGEFNHSKTGVPLFVAKIERRLSREEYLEAQTAAKKLGGYYSSYKSDGAIPGFHFKSSEARDAFIGAGDGGPSLASSPTALFSSPSPQPEGTPIPDIPNWNEHQERLKAAETKELREEINRQYHETHPEAKGLIADRAERKIPPGWVNVMIFPEGSIVPARGKDSKGRPVSVRTSEADALSAAKKFARAKNVNQAIPQAIKQIGNDLESGTAPEESSVLRLIYLTGFRNGGDSDTGAKVKAYGATTLRAEHVEIDGDTAKFDFIGKLGVQQQHTIVNGPLARDLEERKARGGALFDTNATKVLARWKQVSGNPDFIVHDIRTWNATKLAATIIKQNQSPTNPTDFWLLRDQIGDIVARKLGDTRTVVLESYIDPIVFAKWRESASIAHDESRPKISRRDAENRGSSANLGRGTEDYERSLRDELLPPGSPASSGTSARRGGRSSQLTQAALFSSPAFKEDLFTAATAPDATQQLGSVKVGTMNALGAYRALTAKRDAGKALTGHEEEQLLSAEQALGQKLAFDMESVKSDAPAVTQSADARALAMMNRKGFTRADDVIRKQIEDRLKKAGADDDLIYEITVGKFLDMPAISAPTKPAAVFSQNRQAGQDEMSRAGEIDRSGQISLLSSPSPAPDTIDWKKFPPVFRSVYAAVLEGKSLPQIAREMKISEKAVGNILNQIGVRAQALDEAANGGLTPTMRDGLLERGRPERAMSASSPEVARILQIRQDNGDPETIANAETYANAKRMIAADYQGTIERITARRANGEDLTLDEVAAAQMILLGKVGKKRSAMSEAEKLQLGWLAMDWVEQGTDDARRLQIRRDVTHSPAERAALYFAKELYTPQDAATVKALKDAKGRKAKEEVMKRFMERSEGLKNRLKARGIDLEASLEEFRRQQDEKQAMEEAVKQAHDRLTGGYQDKVAELQDQLTKANEATETAQAVGFASEAQIAAMKADAEAMAEKLKMARTELSKVRMLEPGLVLRTALLDLSDAEKAAMETLLNGGTIENALAVGGMSQELLKKVYTDFGNVLKKARLEAQAMAKQRMLEMPPVLMSSAMESDELRMVGYVPWGELESRKVAITPDQVKIKPRKPQVKAADPVVFTPEQQAAIDAAFERFKNADPATWNTLFETESKNLTPIIGQVGFEEFKGKALQPWKDRWQTEMDGIANPAARISFEEWIAKPSTRETAKRERDLFPQPINEITGTFDTTATNRDGTLFPQPINEKTGTWNDTRPFTSQGELIREEISTTTGMLDFNDPVSVRNALREISTGRSSNMDRVMEYWRASILSGPQTAIVNTTSNLAFGTFNAIPRRMVESAVNATLKLVGLGSNEDASFGEFTAMAKHLRGAASLAARKAVESWNQESANFKAYALATENQLNFGGKDWEDFQPALPGKLGTFMRSISFRHMQAADEFGKFFFGQIEVAAQAYRIAKAEGLTSHAREARISELIEKKGSEAWKRTYDIMLKNTFQEKLVSLGEATAAIRVFDTMALKAKDLRAMPYLGRPITFFLPFIMTPTNIAKQAVEISPLGGVLALIDGSRALKRRLSAGKLNTDGMRISKEEAKLAADELYDKARFVRDLTNQVVAWSIYFTLASMVGGDDDDDLPLITGTMAYTLTKRGERDVADRVMPPQSIRIPGTNTFMSYSRMDPFATVMAGMVDMTRSLNKEGGFNSKVATDFLVHTKNSMKDKTFLTGVSNLINALEDPSRVMERLSAGIITGFIPNLIRQPIRETDTVKRDMNPREDDGFAESIAKRLGYAIVPQSAPPKIDVWGKDLPAHNGEMIGGHPVANAIFRTLDPTNLSVGNKIDPLDLYIFKWNNAAQDSDKIGIMSLPDYVTGTVDGKSTKLPLTVTEQTEANRRVGQQAHELLMARGLDHEKPSKEGAEVITETFRQLQTMERANIRNRKLVEMQQPN